MNKPIDVQPTCFKCGTKGVYQLWKSIDVDSQPELRDKILDKSLFVWNCPACKIPNFISSDTVIIYHDVAHKFIIFFNHVKPIITGIAGKPIDDLYDTMGSDYVLREVYGLRNLQEKIRIFEAGLQDTVLEYAKYIILNGIYKFEGNISLTDKNIYFTKKNIDTFTFNMLDKKGNIETFDVPMSVYNTLFEKLKDNKNFECDPMLTDVCYEWFCEKMVCKSIK